MTLNIDNDIKINQQQPVTTGTPTEIPSSKIDIQMVEKSGEQDLYAKLGITRDEYMQISQQNPNFTSLSIEEQLQYIKTYKKSVDAQPETPISNLPANLSNELEKTPAGRKLIVRINNANMTPEDYKDKMDNIFAGQDQYREAYDAAESDEDKAVVMYSYMIKTSKNREEFVQKLKQYSETLNSENVLEHIAFGRYLLEHAEQEYQNAFVSGKNSRELVALNADSLNQDTQTTFAESLNEDIKNGNPEEIEAIKDCYETALNKIDPDNGVNLVIGAYNSGDSDIGKLAVDAKLKMKDRNAALEAMQAELNATEEVILYGAENNHKMQAPVRLEAAKLYADTGNEQVINALAITISKYEEDEQKEVAQTTYAATENLSDEAAIRIQTNIADQIEYCAAQNQAEMHKMVSQSKYAEVVKLAAENIYKYDESAQKDALKYTLETGNKEAIESAIANVDKCSGLSNETAAVPSNSKDYDAVLARTISSLQTQTESLYIQTAATQYADFMSEQDIRSGITSTEDLPTSREQYIEQFKSSSSNKFALLGKLEPGQRKELLKILVKYCPTLINSFVDMGYGKNIVESIGETSELSQKIVKLMDFKGQADVRQIVHKHPDAYEELYAKYFIEDDQPKLAQTLPSSRYSTPPNGCESLLKYYDNGNIIYKT